VVTVIILALLIEWFYFLDVTGSNGYCLFLNLNESKDNFTMTGLINL